MHYGGGESKGVLIYCMLVADLIVFQSHSHNYNHTLFAYIYLGEERNCSKQEKYGERDSINTAYWWLS